MEPLQRVEAASKALGKLAAHSAAAGGSVETGAASGLGAAAGEKLDLVTLFRSVLRPGAGAGRACAAGASSGPKASAEPAGLRAGRPAAPSAGPLAKSRTWGPGLK